MLYFVGQGDGILVGINALNILSRSLTSKMTKRVTSCKVRLFRLPSTTFGRMRQSAPVRSEGHRCVYRLRSGSNAPQIGPTSFPIQSQKRSVGRPAKTTRGNLSRVKNPACLPLRCTLLASREVLPDLLALELIRHAGDFSRLECPIEQEQSTTSRKREPGSRRRDRCCRGGAEARDKGARNDPPGGWILESKWTQFLLAHLT